MLHRAMLVAASWIVPSGLRAGWLEEWRSEFWYVENDAAMSFCAGAFHDALWVRRNCCGSPPKPRLVSPWRCLILLAFTAAVSLFFAARLSMPHLFRDCAIMESLSLVLVAMIGPLHLGDYPANRRFRRWTFFLLKLLLVQVAVCCSTIDLAMLVQGAFLPHGLLAGSILATRWAMADQRRRCPVCLRVVGQPTRIGGASHMFLDWYGTEFVCGKGHGLLYVPEIPASSSSTPRWQELDSSWRGLFGNKRPGSLVC